MSFFFFFFWVSLVFIFFFFFFFFLGHIGHHFFIQLVFIFTRSKNLDFLKEKIDSIFPFLSRSPICNLVNSQDLKTLCNFFSIFWTYTYDIYFSRSSFLGLVTS